MRRDLIHFHTTLVPDERRTLGNMLREGYGMEDIAVKTGMLESEIRKCVDYWRERGVLLQVLRPWRYRPERYLS